MDSIPIAPHCYDDAMPRAAAIAEISNAKHPLLKEIRYALRRGARTKTGLLPLETPHLLEEALGAGLPVETVLFTPALENQVKDLL